MRYNGNRFNPVVFGDRVYVNSATFPGGANVAELNSFTRKVQVPNERIFNPREGVLLVVPSPNAVGANPPLPARSVVGYAWTGGSATVGITLDKAGLLELNPGIYTLVVDGVAVATAQVPAPSTARSSRSLAPQDSPAPLLEETGTCAPGPASLCLGGSRILVELTWKDGAVTRMAQAVPLSGDTGYFYFNTEADAEVMVKVLDARKENGHFWVFFEGLTNLEYTLTVTDTYTGRSKTYRSPAGKFSNRGDRTALPGN